MIIIEKIREKKKLSKGIANTTTSMEVAQALSSVDLARK